MLATLLCLCVAFGPNLADEPLTLEFKRKIGPVKDRKEALGNVQVMLMGLGNKKGHVQQGQRALWVKSAK